jgi:Tfp pilus assembly protein PilN
VIRTNLSTRPFYNERAVHFWLGLLAVVVAIVTLVNMSSVFYYSRSDSEYETAASRDEARAADLRAAAAKLRASVNTAEIQAASAQAEQANALIDRRTFSWTELFNRLQDTLPGDVRITSIRPRTDEGRIILDINVVARGVDDVDRFMTSLEGTGAFLNPLSRTERVTEAGQLEAALEMIYVPYPVAPPEAAR